MTKRITLTLAPELLDELARSKPRALSLSSWCALLVEAGLGRESADTPETGLAKGLTLR